MLITHKKLQPVQCYHISSNSMVVYLAKNHYGSYFPQMVPTMAYRGNTTNDSIDRHDHGSKAESCSQQASGLRKL